MYRKKDSRTPHAARRTLNRQNRQLGYLMPLAAFILVVMGLLAATMLRTSGATAISSSQEAITLQAFYAAESGAQLGMNAIFFDTSNTLTSALADSRCTALNISRNLSIDGLKNCSIVVSCSLSVTGKSHFYTLTSVGSCGGGEVTSSRTIEVSSILKETP